jgi:hypothetical protein
MLKLVISKCKDICTTRLSEGVISPYNSIRELQQYASSLVKTEPRAPNVTLSSDVQTFAIHGKKLHLPTLRSGLRKLYDEVSTALEEVILHQSIPITIPETLADDMSNTTRGYSWLDNATFTEKQYPILEGYLNDPSQRLCWKGLDGKLHFHAAGGSNFMKKTAFVNRGISVLNDIANALPARSTEFVDHKIRNSWRRRACYRDQGRLRWVNQYSKKTNGQKMDTFLPILVADELQALQEKYFILVRPVEELIALELWGQESRVLYHEYMYVEMGQRVNEEMFSRHLRTYLGKYIGADIGVEELRQLSVSIMREYIPAQSHYMVMDQNIGDLIQDHGTGLSRGHYGGLEGGLPYLTTDAMFKYDDFCSKWHCITGFGKHPAPPPLRLLQTGGQPTHSTPVPDTSTSIGDNVEQTGELMQMMRSLMNKVTHMESQLAVQAATTSTTLQEFRVQTKNDIRDGLAECFATFEATTSRTTNHLANIEDDTFVEMDGPDNFGGVADMGNRMEESSESELEYGPVVDIALNAMRLLLRKPTVEYRSTYQRQTIQACLALSSNVVAVMGTGEGKSMAWQVCGKLQPSIKNVIIISSAANLVNQHRRAKDMGLDACLFRFSEGKGSETMFERNNLIFAGMETAGDSRFKA